MAETVRRLKVNKRYETTPCTWCGDALMLGEDGAICEACDSPHHARCWDENNGCGKAGCPNAPLKVIKEPPPKPQKRLAPGEQLCPFCGDVITDNYCFSCRQTPQEGPYEGAQTLAPEVKNALIFAGVGLFCFGPYFGYKAITSASEGKRQIEGNPRYSGAGLAVFAQVMGFADIVLWVVGILLRIAGA
ncbi:MAG TPA: RING finger protein [Pyrinomonadaceae bacterium]|jgi:hypothetical protein